MLPRTWLLGEQRGPALVWPGVEPEVHGALAQGAKLVVVTRGGEGAAGTATGADVPPVAVQVIDTVGAGDTFQAALLTWLAERDALSAPALAALSKDALGDALGFAARAAAITCSRRGADMPRRAEL
jgi:fructokinase